jgi:hypothetical protein
VEVEAIGRLTPGELRPRDRSQPAELLRADPEQVERDVPAGGLDEVGAEPAAALRELVHDDDPALELERRAQSGRDRDAVVDDPGRRPAGVPHERIERGAVDEQDIRIVDRVARVGRVDPGRIVLEEDPWSALLLGREDLPLVLGPVLLVLVEHEVDVEVADGLRRDLADRLGPGGVVRTAAVARWPTRLHRHDDVVPDMAERLDVAAVDVPGQDRQATHRTSSLSRFLERGGAGSMSATSRRPSTSGSRSMHGWSMGHSTR